MGRVGYVCAHATGDSAEAPMTVLAKCRNFRRGSSIVAHPWLWPTFRKYRKGLHINDFGCSPAEGTIAAFSFTEVGIPAGSSASKLH
jgi:hypothetical protein